MRNKRRTTEELDALFRPTVTEEIWSKAKEELKDMIIDGLLARSIAKKHLELVESLDNTVNLKELGKISTANKLANSRWKTYDIHKGEYK